MFGLLGKGISHSLSKTVHEALNPQMTYHLYETHDLRTFLASVSFKGLNVTHPYKKDIIIHLDALDDTAKQTGVVNTVKKTDGKLTGYNTDYLALKKTLSDQLPKNLNTPIGILGNGATMSSTKQALMDIGRHNINVYARHPKTSEHHLSLIDEATEVLINTTPVGMYPNNEAVIDLPYAKLKSLRVMIDMIYNPLRTNFLLEGVKRGIKVYNGLALLVEQAALTQHIILGEKPPVNDYVQRLENSLWNTCLIGMPFSGKTHYGRKLETAFNRKFFDIDREIEITQNMQIETMFKQKGETYFRQIEKQILKKHAKTHGQIISTGGGVVEQPELMWLLKQNSVIIYLDLDPSLLNPEKMDRRPLTKSIEDWHALNHKREHLYSAYADIVIKKDTLDETIILRRIKEAMHAYFSH